MKIKKYILYCHQNKINGKLYFGITSTSLDMRFRNGRGYKKQVFYRAIKKYGWDNFNHIIILDNLEHDIACECEKFLIKKYKTNDSNFGYNITEGGEGNTSSPSDESILKHSLATRGEKHWHYGQHWDEEIKQKMRKPHNCIRGDNNPSKRQDVREKISLGLKRWREEHPDVKFNTSHICTQQMKDKISQANQGENNGNYNKHWYNNGEIEILTFECPNGFVKGRLRRNKE